MVCLSVCSPGVLACAKVLLHAGAGMATDAETMEGAVLPGNSTVVFRRQPVPEPGHGQVLVRMKASSICGSDIRAIYREHLGKGDEAVRDVIAGHEPCGQVTAAVPFLPPF